MKIIYWNIMNLPYAYNPTYHSITLNWKVYILSLILFFGYKLLALGICLYKRPMDTHCKPFIWIAIKVIFFIFLCFILFYIFNFIIWLFCKSGETYSTTLFIFFIFIVNYIIEYQYNNPFKSSVTWILYWLDFSFWMTNLGGM